MAKLGRASNGTLGVWKLLLPFLTFPARELDRELTFEKFEKVVVLGLQGRSDKRDAMVLSSSLTGFEVEFLDAMMGSEVSQKALPSVRLSAFSMMVFETEIWY